MITQILKTKLHRLKIKGFTLIEAIIVIGLIVGLVALSLPHLVNLYIHAKETSALASLGKISAAMEVYRTLYKTYPQDLTQLVIVNPTLSIDELLRAGSKGGYNFRIEQESFSANTYSAIAEPKAYNITGRFAFKVDQTGIFYRDAIPGAAWISVGGSGVAAAVERIIRPE
jgi:type II secretory pathway pseudopilin PulG